MAKLPEVNVVLNQECPGGSISVGCALGFGVPVALGNYVLKKIRPLFVSYANKQLPLKVMQGDVNCNVEVVLGALIKEGLLYKKFPGWRFEEKELAPAQPQPGVPLPIFPALPSIPKLPELPTIPISALSAMGVSMAEAMEAAKKMSTTGLVSTAGAIKELEKRASSGLPPEHFNSRCKIYDDVDEDLEDDEWELDDGVYDGVEYEDD